MVAVVLMPTLAASRTRAARLVPAVAAVSSSSNPYEIDMTDTILGGGCCPAG